MDGGEPRRIGANESILVGDLPAGEHSVQLSDVADNCVVAGENPRSVTVISDEVVPAAFQVACATTLGALSITVTTTGPDTDPDGYTVQVDQGPAQPIATNGTVTLLDVTPGSHTVELGGVEVGCGVTGENPRAVEIVAGQAATVAFAVACEPGVQRWSAMSSGTNADLPDVWGTSATDVFVVGELPVGNDFEIASVILRYDGTRWSRQLRETDLVLRGVWGPSPSEMFAVGYDFGSIDAKVLRYDGSAWSHLPGFESDGSEQLALLAVSGSSATNAFAVGSKFDGLFEHSLIYRYDGTEWRRMPEPTQVSPALTDVWVASPTVAFAVGRNDVSDPPEGVILRFDGTTWSPAFQDERVGVNAVWGASESDVFVAGFRVDQRGVDFDVFGVILHYDGTTWSPMPLPRTGVLNGIWGTSGSDVFAVGDDGAVLHYDGRQWSLTTPTDQTLLDVWGDSPSDVFAVGLGGTIIRGTP